MAAVKLSSYRVFWTTEISRKYALAPRVCKGCLQ